MFNRRRFGTLRGLDQSFSWITLDGVSPKHLHIDGLVQERHNSSSLAMELRLLSTDSKYLRCTPIYATNIVLDSPSSYKWCSILQEGIAYFAQYPYIDQMLFLNLSGCLIHRHKISKITLTHQANDCDVILNSYTITSTTIGDRFTDMD